MFLFNVKILIFQVVKGLKGQYGPKFQKFLSVAPYISGTIISYDLHLWYTCMYKRIMSSGIFLIFFFFFFKILIFEIIRKRVKGQKMTQNGKKFCQSHSVFQDPYIIWLWFLLHMSKIMMSSAIFSIFSKFWFFEFLGE